MFQDLLLLLLLLVVFERVIIMVLCVLLEGRIVADHAVTAHELAIAVAFLLADVHRLVHIVALGIRVPPFFG